MAYVVMVTFQVIKATLVIFEVTSAEINSIVTSSKIADFITLNFAIFT